MANVIVPTPDGGLNADSRPTRTSDIKFSVKVNGTKAGLPVEIDRKDACVKYLYFLDDPLGGTMYLPETIGNVQLKGYRTLSHGKANFWPVGKAPWNGSYNIESYFRDNTSDVTKVAAGGYYPLVSDPGHAANISTVYYHQSGLGITEFTVTRSETSLVIANRYDTTQSKTYINSDFPSGVIPNWIIAEVQAAGGGGSSGGALKSGNAGGGGAWWMGAIYLGHGPVTFTMGQAGVGSPTPDVSNDASSSTVKISGTFSTSRTITVNGGYGGNHGTYYGCGGVRVDSSALSSITDPNGYVLGYHLAAYSGGNATKRPNSEKEYDRENYSIEYNYTTISSSTDPVYYKYYGTHSNGKTYYRGESQPNWGGQGGGCSFSGDGAKGAAGVGGSNTLYSAGIGGGGGGGGSANNSGTNGGPWGLWIYY